MRPLTARLSLLLATPPLLWAGNAVVGRLLADSAPPVLLNALRWVLALLVLLPFSARRAQYAGALRQHAAWWLMTGCLGMSAYNTLQYQALHTASAVNVTLIAASLPLAMLLVGLLCFGVRPRSPQVLGALLAVAGVVVVVGQGQWQRLQNLHWVQGDGLMLLATFSWAGYSWLLVRRPADLSDWDWADVLLLQIVCGLLLALPLAAAEQLWTQTPLHVGTPLIAALAYIALGPSVLAYRCWSLGVRDGGPSLAAVFVNLTPLFAAFLSAVFLGEAAQWHHAMAFVLIAAGIWVAARA
jgi:drug/metabolite transporter (DMT)-like permease